MMRSLRRLAKTGLLATKTGASRHDSGSEILDSPVSSEGQAFLNPLSQVEKLEEREK